MHNELPKARNFQRGWGQNRNVYACADYLQLCLPKAVFRLHRQKKEDAGDCAFPRNGISYEKDDETGRAQLLLVSEIEFDREMSRLVRVERDVRTIIFPSTVRRASDGAFAGAALGAVVLNEGLEELG